MMRPDTTSFPVAEEQEDLSRVVEFEDECSLVTLESDDARAATSPEGSPASTGTDWELLRSTDSSASTSWSIGTTPAAPRPHRSYRDALLVVQEKPLGLAKTAAAPAAATTGRCGRTGETDGNGKKKAAGFQAACAASEGDDPASAHLYDMFEAGSQRPRCRNSHTTRRNVSVPDDNLERKFVGPPLWVMDRDHVPQINRWGCEVIASRKERQWLQMERRHMRHVDRRNRKESLQRQSPEEYIYEVFPGRRRRR
jgi:hypothetical protein